MIKCFFRIHDLQKIIEKEKSKRIFLVSGQKSFEICKAKEFLEKAFKDIIVYRYFNFGINPKIDDVAEGARLAYDFKPDLMIAIGGGSVLDTAKLISILPKDLKEIKEIVKDDFIIKNRNYPLVAIPTTSGSGSESTHFAVVYSGYKKYSVANKSLLPDYIILDHYLTHSMSPYLTAVTGMDALSQAIESFWAKGANNRSKLFAGSAIKTILKVFPDVVYHPNLENRREMMQGSHAAGEAINISKTTAPHAISYILTILYGIPHGHAVALTLPQFFEYNLGNDNNNCDQNNLSNQERQDLFDLIGCKTVSEGREKLENIIKLTGLETKLSKLGSKNRKDINMIIQNINIERLNNNPRVVTEKVLKDILENIW